MCALNFDEVFISGSVKHIDEQSLMSCLSTKSYDVI